MAIEWIKTGDDVGWVGHDRARGQCEVTLCDTGNVDSTDPELIEWCIHPDGRCLDHCVVGLKNAKAVGARYIYGCLKPPKEE